MSSSTERGHLSLGWNETGPFWGTRAFPPKSGQDHLGLGSVSSDQILPALSPGINVLTIHPRYWSFYAFVLDDFWNRELPRNRATFTEFYRPREALFSMACHVCEAPEHKTLVANIVGSRRIAPLAGNEQFDPQFDYIKEPLGGYGLYYRSAMEATGALVIATPSNGFAFDAATPDGRALAHQYREAISGTELLRSHLSGDLRSPVGRDLLVEFAGVGCLCQLRNAPNHDLPLLQDLFAHAGGPSAATARRETLRLVLDLSGTAQPAAIGQSEFRQLVYFRRLEEAEYVPRKDLTRVARRWRLYQAREYFAFAFNRLFGWVVRKGQLESDAGLTIVSMSRLWEMVDNALNGNTFDKKAKLEAGGIGATTVAAAFVDQLTTRLDLGGSVDAVWPRDALIDEHALYESCNNTTDDDETLVAMIALLLLIHRRVGTPSRIADLLDDRLLLSEGGALRIGMARFFHQFTKRLMAGHSLSEFARWILKDYVIVQHERVATAKLPDDTFRVRRVGDGLQFFVRETPAAFNDSRFTALSTTAHELGFVSTLRDPERTLTQDGRLLLTTGDLPDGALASVAEQFETDWAD